MNEIIQRGDQYSVEQELVISRAAIENPQRWGKFLVENIYQLSMTTYTRNNLSSNIYPFRSLNYESMLILSKSSEEKNETN